VALEEPDVGLATKVVIDDEFDIVHVVLSTDVAVVLNGMRGQRRDRYGKRRIYLQRRKGRWSAVPIEPVSVTATLTAYVFGVVLVTVHVVEELPHPNEALALIGRLQMYLYGPTLPDAVTAY